jgi:hypothetical protein
MYFQDKNILKRNLYHIYKQTQNIIEHHPRI